MTTDSKERKSVITVRIPQSQYNRAKDAAKAQGLSLNLFAVAAICGWANDVLDGIEPAEAEGATV